MYSQIPTIAAQRQVGETALNDKSSRSHQIIRLVSLFLCSFLCFIEDVFHSCSSLLSLLPIDISQKWMLSVHNLASH